MGLRGHWAPPPHLGGLPSKGRNDPPNPASHRWRAGGGPEVSPRGGHGARSRPPATSRGPGPSGAGDVGLSTSHSPALPVSPGGGKAAEAAMSRLMATKKSGLVVGTQNLGCYPQLGQGEATGWGISKRKSRAVEIKIIIRKMSPLFCHAWERSQCPRGPQWVAWGPWCPLPSLSPCSKAPKRRRRKGKRKIRNRARPGARAAEGKGRAARVPKSG